MPAAALYKELYPYATRAPLILRLVRLEVCTVDEPADLFHPLNTTPALPSVRNLHTRIPHHGRQWGPTVLRACSASTRDLVVK